MRGFRKMKVWLFTLLTTGIILTICAVFCGCGGSLTYPSAGKYTSGSGSVDGAAVKDVDLSWLAGKVNITYHPEETITFSETSDRVLSDELSLHWWLDGSTLRIQFAASGRLNLSALRKELTLTLPESFAANNVKISLASADLQTATLRAAYISVNTASGSVRLSSDGAKEIQVNTASGDVHLIQTGSTDTVKLHTASGDLYASLEQVGYAETETASGNIQMEADRLTKGKAETASGEVDLYAKQLPTDYRIETASGDVSVRYPADASFTLKIDTASGDFKSDFAMKQDGNTYTCKDGTANLRIETSSGDISVYAADVD